MNTKTMRFDSIFFNLPFFQFKLRLLILYFYSSIIYSALFSMIISTSFLLFCFILYFINIKFSSNSNFMGFNKIETIGYWTALFKQLYAPLFFNQKTSFFQKKPIFLLNNIDLLLFTFFPLCPLCTFCKSALYQRGSYF